MTVIGQRRVAPARPALAPSAVVGLARRGTPHRGRRRGDPGRAAPRPDRDAPLRRDGLARAGALRAPRDRLRRARPRRLGPGAEPDAYSYDDLAADLLAVLDARGLDRAVLAGASMGAHTALRLALDAARARSPGSSSITPAYDPGDHRDAASLRRWDALSDGLREGGVEGFVAAYGEPAGGPALARDAADASCASAWPRTSTPRRSPTRCASVPRSRPFERPRGARGDRRARRSSSPTATSRTRAIRSRVGEAYAQRSPARGWSSRSRGQSPIAWQGGAALDASSPRSPARPHEQRAGYSGTPLAAKLGLKPGMRVAWLGAPEHFAALIGELPDGVRVVARARRAARPRRPLRDAPRRARAQAARAARARSRPTARVWVGVAEARSGVPTDITEDVVRDVALPLGLVDVEGLRDRRDVVRAQARDPQGAAMSDADLRAPRRGLRARAPTRAGPGTREALHGGAPAALLAREIERTEPGRGRCSSRGSPTSSWRPCRWRR